MRRVRGLAPALILFGFSACLAADEGVAVTRVSPDSASAGTEERESNQVAASDCEMDETDRALLKRVNEARSQARQCGDQDFGAAEPLAWNCKLEDAARAHTEDMAEMEFFSHTGPEGVRTGERADESGYRWSAVGENIAAGQNSVDNVVDGWLSSPGHCANIMNSDFTEMGAARVEVPGSRYSPFWTQVLARPR